MQASKWDRSTALHLAAGRGHEAVVWLLLDNGPNVNAKGDNGWISLHRAASSGHEAAVLLLLDREGVDADSQDKDGRRPLS
jgi:ankyrin repeat protein